MTISAVVMQAARMKPLPASTPIAPVLQMLAAVLRPRTLRPSRMITPAPRKPMPLTTWAAMRVTLTSLSSNSGRIEAGRTECDHRVGGHAGRALSPLSLETDQRTEAEGRHQADGDFRGHAVLL